MRREDGRDIIVCLSRVSGNKRAGDAVPREFDDAFFTAAALSQNGEMV